MGPTQHKAAFIWTKCWRPFLTIIIPLALSLIFLWGGKGCDCKTEKCKESMPKDLTEEELLKRPRAAFIVALMACYWVSECLPLSVTALCPVFLSPLLGIVDSDDVAGCYLNSSVMLLAAGCIIAQAFEYSNLHTRIALKVACIVGAWVPLLLAGVMFTAMFLSMWMNNTSTTSMMVPILNVIMAEFETGVADSAAVAVDAKLSIRPSTVTITDEADAKSKEVEEIRKKKLVKARNIKNMFLLGAAWASNIGGTGIITGTATNIIAQSALNAERIEMSKIEVKDRDKCQKALEISFPEWIEFNAAPMLLSTILTWMILLVWFTGLPNSLNFRKRSPYEQAERTENQKVIKNVEKAILAKYNSLGRITLHEILVLVIFSVLVVLWITGKIGDTGWFTLEAFADYDQTKPKIYPSAATPAILMCLLLFVIPKDLKYYKDFANGGLSHGLKDPVLPWSEVETKVPWGALILIGGGVAISQVIGKSGLGDAIGFCLQNSEMLSDLSKETYLALILVVVAFLTTIASNTATAAILSPVLIKLSLDKGFHPLYLLVSATVGASYAFILPISTPPNAIVYDKSDMKQKDMALPGIIVTIVTNVVLYAMVHTYCEIIFKFNAYDNPCKQLKIT